MSQGEIYIQASLSRAVNDGQRSLTVSTLDLLDVFAELARFRAKQENEESGGVTVGYARPDMIADMKCGKAMFLSVRRKQSYEYSVRISTKKSDSAYAKPLAHDGETIQD